MPGRILFIRAGNICVDPGGLLSPEICGDRRFGGAGGIAIMRGIRGAGGKGRSRPARTGRDFPGTDVGPGNIRCRDRSGPVLYDGKYMLRDYRLPRDFCLLRHYRMLRENKMPREIAGLEKRAGLDLPVRAEIFPAQM